MPHKVSLRDLARRLGLSHTTVSEALRGHTRVNEQTRQRVQKLADELGYRRNILAGALMAEMRRSQIGAFHGTLAIVDLDGPNNRSEGSARYHKELANGATRRAEQLDFKTDLIVADTQKFSFARLEKILQTRGIRGILLLPIYRPDITRFDWSGFSAIYTDYVIEHPRLHAVCPDHYRAMLTVLERLRQLGYRRPGLVLHGPHDQRLLHRWEAAYNVFQAHHGGALIPEFIRHDLAEERSADFTNWFNETKCDVVIAHSPDVKRWMEAAGARIPATHGFCSLNIVNASFPCAGLDLLPHVLGERAMEQLIGQVMRNECGVPERAVTLTVQSEWVDGPTVRPMSQ